MTFERHPHAKLPVAFLSLLERLRTFQAASLSDNSKQDVASLYAELLDQRLVTDAERLDERACDTAFVEGVIRAMFLADTVVDDVGIVDSFGSKTLQHFEPDYRGNAENRSKVLRALGKSVSLSDEEVESLATEFHEREGATFSATRSIVGALDQLYDLNDPNSVRALFAKLYRDYPIDVDVRAIRTATSVFFCVPFEAVDHLSEEDAKQSALPLARLWGNAVDLRQKYMAHFPVFGFFDGHAIDPDLMDKLVELSGLERKRCGALLTTMISILPAKDVDKYIVHDAWGHQWQALLFGFEETYRDTALYHDPPELDATHDGLSLESLLDHEQKGWAGDVERYLSAEVERRLIRSVAGLFAEVLADAMEYKFLYLRPDLSEMMPSSSELKELPTKLDLTLHDLPIYIRFAFRGLFDIASPTFEHSDRPQWERFAAIVSSWSNFESQFAFESHDGRLLLSAHAQLALQFFELVVACNDVFLDRKLTEDSSPYFDRHFDVLLFSLAAFFEADRERHFWQLDEFVRYAFSSRFHALQETLRQESR